MYVMYVCMYVCNVGGNRAKRCGLNKSTAKGGRVGKRLPHSLRCADFYSELLARGKIFPLAFYLTEKVSRRFAPELF